MTSFLRRGLFGFILLCTSLAQAAPVTLRWTGAQDRNAAFEHVLERINARTGFQLKPSDFKIHEDLRLATSRFFMAIQVLEDLTIRSMSVRIWSDLATGEAIQVEAQVQDPAEGRKHLLSTRGFARRAGELSKRLSAELTRKRIERIARLQADDPHVRTVSWVDEWWNGRPVRSVTARGRHGTHRLTLSLINGKVLSASYRPFPRSDEFSLPGLVYPVYEEVEATGELTERVPVELRYLKSRVRRADADPYGALRDHRYFDHKQDPFLGELENGRELGYWSMAYVRRQASLIREGLPEVSNSFDNGGVLLEGRYATVSLHPDILKTVGGLDFVPRPASVFLPLWRTLEEGAGPDAPADATEEMIPMASLLGRPLLSARDAYERAARRLPDHDPRSYLSDGFDEVQVYHAINALFDALRPMGFTDPELSTRPFHAFLYDPAVSMRDNAYYVDDTINFTTYSPKAINFARDNTTIWHELGHGIMDRLLGSLIHLADTGGLDEGVADFLSELVTMAVTGGEPYPGMQYSRILNKTGFYLTNEVHDDGEAYGGALKDLLSEALGRFGEAGLAKVADLTFETMRLTRNHPRLTAADWFARMFFADERGSALRAAGELRSLLEKALSGRNFEEDPARAARFIVRNGAQEVTDRAEGSRAAPVPVFYGGEDPGEPEEEGRAADDEGRFVLSVQVRDGERYRFRFPVTVKVLFEEGPLQGAAHWEGEEGGPRAVTLRSPEETAAFPLRVTPRCDSVNRDDGSCVDFVYLQVWNSGETEKPQAKKRFYVRVKPRG